MIVVGEVRNGAEALTALDALSPISFSSMCRCPEMDGFEVLRARGADRMPAVVFVTAHDQFAVRAFEAHALDYLIKPLHVERFEAALQRVRERRRLMEAMDLAARLTALLEAQQAGAREAGGVEGWWFRSRRASWSSRWPRSIGSAPMITTRACT